MILCLEIAGVLLVLLAVLHIGFPRYFRWEDEFVTVSLINRQMVYFHTFFLALIILLMGILCLIAADELTNTHLGHMIDLGLALFWIIRLLVQFFGYSSGHWRGKRFEMLIHLLFSLLWIFLTTVFLLASGIFRNQISG
jgi:hypothetical protein